MDDPAMLLSCIARTHNHGASLRRSLSPADPVSVSTPPLPTACDLSLPHAARRVSQPRVPYTCSPSSLPGWPGVGPRPVRLLGWPLGCLSASSGPIIKITSDFVSIPLSQKK